jgi:predicted HTH transcriptional regulator
MDLNLISSLLLENESTTLDFKEREYRFEGASAEEKAELLKDILAFANASREGDAYIIVGVRHRAGEGAEPIGVNNHPDDAAIQQFVNQKNTTRDRLFISGSPLPGRSTRCFSDSEAAETIFSRS